MLTSDQIKSAGEYNSRVAGRLWRAETLPQPFRFLLGMGIAPAHSMVAMLVAQFQSVTGQVVDGKLGPDTLSALRAVHGSEQTELSYSNTMVVDGEYVECDFDIANHIADGTTPFGPYKGSSKFHRAAPPTHIVIHESVTRSVESTVRVLQRKEFGVHFMIGPDGLVTQHNDPVTEAPVHGNQLNASSVGIEIVTPYLSGYLAPGSLWTRTIKPTKELWYLWRHDADGDSVVDDYVPPTEPQIEACAKLIRKLTESISTIPLSFPTAHLSAWVRRIEGWDKGAKPDAGIVAHRDYASHADGRYILERMMEMLT